MIFYTAELLMILLWKALEMFLLDFNQQKYMETSIYPYINILQLISPWNKNLFPSLQ